LVGLYNTALHYVLRALPIDACSNFGGFLSFYSPFFFRDADTRARAAWARLHPEQADQASADAMMKRLWRSIGRTMTEYSVIDRLWDAGRISVEGIEHMQAARTANKPLLVAALHLGNWETVMVAGIRMGFPGSGVYLPLDNRFDMRLAMRARKRYQSNPVSGAAGPSAMRTAVRMLRTSRQPFALYIDEFIRGRVQAPAFGRTLRPDSNLGYVARLAALTGGIVIPAYCVRTGDSAHFTVRFLPPVDIATSGDRNADLTTNMKRINDAIEPVIRQHFDQWFFALDIEFDDNPVTRWVDRR
jgi:KDO2-lipid IV(A) lauroyltransferase